MSDYRASFRHVSRKVFIMVCYRLEDSNGAIPYVTISYDGNEQYGDLTIVGQDGHFKQYIRTLRVFNEEYCK